MAVWRNWQTRLIQNQVSYGREGSSPFTATSEIARVCLLTQRLADSFFLLVMCGSMLGIAAFCCFELRFFFADEL